MNNFDLSNSSFEIAKNRQRIETTPGESIIATAGSVVLAGKDSQVIADRCSFVIAEKQSCVLALPGSIVIYEEGAEVSHCKKSLVLKSSINKINPPFEFAKGKGEKFGDNRMIVAFPGSEFEAGNGCTILALSNANFTAGNYCRIVASGYSKIETGIGCDVDADQSCTVRRNNIVPFPPVHYDQLDQN